MILGTKQYIYNKLTSVFPFVEQGSTVLEQFFLTKA